MCMASYFPAGVMPVRSEIENGARLNSDGHGYAIVTRDRNILIRKGMNADEIVTAFVRERTKHPEGPALFHSRIATSGHVDVTGCHPFKVGQDNRTVLAHNGILFNPGKDSDRSDTAIFASDMLPRFGSLDKSKSFRKLQKFIGRGNKLVILTVNPARRQTSYLVNESAGVWAQSGAWHSNYDYEGSWWDADAYHGLGFTYGTKIGGKPKVIRYGMSVFACEICGAYDAVSMSDGICEVCNSCNDCKMHVNTCMCYVPHSTTRAAIAIGTGGHSS